MSFEFVIAHLCIPVVIIEVTLQFPN